MLSRYSSLGASSRLRLIQYRPFLERAGADVVISPFFDDDYLQHLYSAQRRRVMGVYTAYLRRVRALLDAKNYSVVWVQREIFPFLPASFEAWLARYRIPYIVDYDDATFHTYDQHRWPLVRWLLGQKLDPLISHARCAVVGNTYLESYVRAHGAKRVVRLPTVVDLQRYKVVDEPGPGELRIGWIGTPETTHYLHLVRDSLRAMSSERPLRLITIGASPLEDFGIPLEQHPWSEATEAKLLESIHIGIMPLPDQAWERGKCGYKLIQYMACGKPVIASPVGVNRDIVTNRVGGLADGTIEWLQALRLLANDPQRRRAYGKAARDLVESEYSLHATAPIVVDLLRVDPDE